VEEMVTDSARYDVFKITDCVLAGRVNRAIKILNGLKAEGLAAPVVLWALAREIRLLINIKKELNLGKNIEAVFKTYRIWEKRKNLVNSALSRLQLKDFQQALLLSSKVDRQIKGQEKGDYWETLLFLCLLFRSPAF
jgi:DNA polymerase-3 subunit delta